VSYIKAKDKVHEFSTTGGSAKLNMNRLETQAERDSLLAQRQELDDAIKSLSDEQKRLNADASTKRKLFYDASKVLKDIQSKKSKIDTPIIATMENIFLTFEISPAKYHGGKLNGVDCQKVMSCAKDFFFDIQELLLSIVHPQRCSDKTIIDHCNICHDILVTLDLICSKIRIWQRKSNI
jgi:seryl-tRNA synthetase